MMDASATPIFAACVAWVKANLARFKHVDAAFAESISPHIPRSATESTLHGCPPDEIERIATYLICEKGLHTYIKCNPTLLGYEFARKTMDDLGYDYVAFDDHQILWKTCSGPMPCRCPSGCRRFSDALDIILERNALPFITGNICPHTCGNCAVFCPHNGGRPYKDKLTLFWSREDFDDSENEGFLQVEGGFLVRLDGKERVVDVHDAACGIPGPVRAAIAAVCGNYPYLLR